MQKYDLIIVGAGAAGMLAAIQANAEAPQLRIALLERLPRPGKKLLATGNGRCNIANAAASREHYYNAAGQNPAFVQPALQKYTQQDNLAFFRSMGLLTKQEAEGKMYPLGDQAVAVLDTLRLQLAARQLALICEAEVRQIEQTGGGWQLRLADGRLLHARALLLAMGGLASPQLSHSQGFADLLAPLGLKTTRLYPALTQLKCNSPLPKALQGIKFNGRAALWQADELLAEAEGEILFAAYGLSGPPILQLSRWAARNFYANSQPAAQEIQLDLLPQMSRAELLAELSARRALPLLLEDFLTGLLNKRLGQQLLKLLPGERKLSAPSGSLTEADLAALAALIKALPLAVCGVTGWERAQVMAGGLELKGFESQTLAARRLPGLFAAGELLDVCGDCGGYNLSWAWSSGRLAAHSAVQYLLSD